MRVDKILCGHTLVGTRSLVRPSTRAAYVFDTLRIKKMMKIIKNDYGSINNTRFTVSDKATAGNKSRRVVLLYYITLFCVTE